LKRGNATILTGVEDTETSNVIDVFREVCGTPEVSTDGVRTTGVAFVLPITASIKI
jgi:uncharacterized protein YaaQ